MDPAQKKDEILLTNLIIMFQTAAMQQMGKLKNPISDKIEKDLEQASISIDMLEMIRRKAEGKLTDTEKKLLDSVLNELRLNYIAEKEKGGEKGGEKREAESSDESEKEKNE